jgi:RNA polymerase sigma factor (sigma-70 family)
MKLQAFVSDVSSLDDLDDPGDGPTRGIPESLEPRRINTEIAQFQLDQQLEELMKQLNPREQAIIRYRYGLEDGRAHTLEQTGHKLGLTRERIRQIENDVMRRLRVFVASHGDDFRP